jgi:putative ABC transport system substrate-binding protein
VSFVQGRRRAVLAGLAGVALVRPAVSRAQTQALPRIAYLSGRSQADDGPLAQAFRDGLAQLGYVDGRNVVIDYRGAEGRVDQVPRLVAELIALKPALIFAASTGSAVAAKAATTTIPIVFGGASDPVRLGLVDNLARPGGNLTGATRFAHALGPKRLQLLLDLAPGTAPITPPSTRTVAVLYNPGNPNAVEELRDVSAAAAALGVTVTPVEARSEAAIEQGFAALGAARVHALYILDDPFYVGRIAQLIAALAIRHGIATVSTSPAFSRAGALASYGADFAAVYRQCGLYAGRILKGEKPGDLPVVLPTRFELAINLGTARALGLALSPAQLAVADEIID